MDIDKNALVITRDEISIAAPLERVWELFTDVPAWPSWQNEIESAALEGEFQAGATFIWTTAGMKIASTVGQLIPHERIVWSGLARGIMGIHVWNFSSTAGGTLVQTEESWDGASVRPQIDLFQKTLDQAIRSWLESLKRAAESERP
jgi:uncharacterized membrane protein